MFLRIVYHNGREKTIECKSVTFGERFKKHCQRDEDDDEGYEALMVPISYEPMRSRGTFQNLQGDRVLQEVIDVPCGEGIVVLLMSESGKTIDRRGLSIY